MTGDTIATRLASILERIERARVAAGGHAVRLVAVSKHQPAAAIAEAIAAGQLDFGENYAQELALKRDELPDERLRWHMIGPVQSNKAKLVVGCAVIHTVDRTSLIDSLERRAVERGLVPTCLVQVNVAGEPGKAGCTPDQLPALLDAIAGCAALSCSGLMLIPRPGTSEEVGAQFTALARLRDREAATRRARVELRELSMGMSDDFELAIQHGATIVRVGTAIFGARTPASVVDRAGS